MSRGALASLAVWVVLATSPAHADTLSVGSKLFTESRLLGELMAQVIEARTDHEVERRLGLGGTTVVFSALRAGEVDLYAEYTGTGWSVHLARAEPVRDPLRAFAGVQDGFRQWDLQWLPPFGFNNTYALAVREPVAERLGLETVSDLAAHAAELKVGVSHEFLERPDGWPGLSKAYGLSDADVRGLDHGLAYEALAAGQIDLLDAYSTDGKLTRYPVRMLADDKRYFPPYSAAPVIRGEVVRRFPEVAEALSTLAFRLDDATMRGLNAQVEIDKRSFADVARSFLEAEGLVASTSTSTPSAPRDQGFIALFVDRLPETGRLAWEHLLLTFIAVLLAVVFAVPLGLLVVGKRAQSGVLGVAAVLQTVPSLALLALLIPVLGLGATTAVAALFLYALLPILRNTVTGIDEVEPHLIEAAVGMGMREGEVMRLVKLPLAAPTIMAGIRTAAVISVGVATLAAFIGAGGLGEPIVTGLALNDLDLVMSGALPAAVLAIAVDAALALVARLVAPGGAT